MELKMNPITERSEESDSYEHQSEQIIDNRVEKKVNKNQIYVKKSIKT